MAKKTDRTPEPPPFWQKNWQKLIALLFWGILLGGYTWYYTSHNLTPLKAVQQIVDLLQTPYGPLIYILIYALRPLIFFSTIVLTVTAGAVFGAGSVLNFALAVIYTVIGSNISAMLAYFIGRYFGQGLLKEGEGNPANVVQKYASRLRRNSFETVMIMRFIFLPYDLVNYLCGFLRINWQPFLLATALGSIPGTIAFIAFGASVDLSQLETQGLPPPNPWVLGFGVVLMVVSIAISRYFKQREANQAGPENQDDQEQTNVLNTSIS
ncbi:MAG: hypothetical protein DPW09_09920 [Anaerolineae bacterium]|nr:hypothetical protein [Anaerolineae bacterium]